MLADASAERLAVGQQPPTRPRIKSGAVPLPPDLRRDRPGRIVGSVGSDLWEREGFDPRILGFFFCLLISLSYI